MAGKDELITELKSYDEIIKALQTFKNKLSDQTDTAAKVCQVFLETMQKGEISTFYANKLKQSVYRLNAVMEAADHIQKHMEKSKEDIIYMLKHM